MANRKWQMAKFVTTAFALLLSGSTALSSDAMTQAYDSGSNAPAQTKPSNSSTGAKPPFNSVHGGFVAITVPDLDAAAKWYVEKLGLKIVKDHAMRPDKKAAVTILQGSGFSVELIWLADASPLSKVAPQLKGPQEIHGILKSGIFVDDLDATLKELKSRNVTFAFETFYDKSMDCRMFAIRDNNGNILQFFGK
jgi:catechol 2,3-dioxygenase-like lactoylglutathione lyase family enzyme